MAGAGVLGGTSAPHHLPTAEAGEAPDRSGSNSNTGSPGSLLPFDLRCESLTDPLGVNARAPRLSWKLRATDDARSLVQTAYRIRVASSAASLQKGRADLWDSNVVQSNRQLHIAYEGRPLLSMQRCFWRVDVWDASGQQPASSAVASWEMGLLSPSDWSGTWISDGVALPDDDAGFYEEDPAPLLRRRFRVDKPVKRARLYATALGYCELRLNGSAVSDEVLSPAWTSTGHRVFYSCHDITEKLVLGENCVGAVLGNGWRNPLPLRMWGRINLRDHLPVGRPELLAQVVIEFQDGTTMNVVTDDNWRCTGGPILRNSVYLGEVYDARREKAGWDLPGFDDTDWQSATPVVHTRGDQIELAGARCAALPMPPIRATATVPAIALSEPSPGVFIFDLGQNFAGWARLRVSGPRGTTVRMRMGELLYADGTLNPMTAVAGQIKRLNDDGESIGGPGAPEIAWQENVYTLRGDGEEVYTPRFTFHGFRYVEVTGFPGTPNLSAIEGLRLNTDVATAGSFSCSNERFNKIQQTVRWTLLSNLFSVQSDCPAREKFQYGGDIVASSEMAIYNFDMAAFYAKAVTDFRDDARGGWFTETAPYVGISAANYADAAGPIGWGLAHPLLLAQLFQYYGDRRIVEEHYDAARTWVDLLEEASDGYIIDRCIGDHESLDPKPIELVATAQFYQAASLVAGFAELLGKAGDAERYRELAASIRSAFVVRFLEPGTGRFDIATQAAQSTALYMGLVPDAEMEAANKRMVDAVAADHDGHIAGGIFGTKYLLNMLTESGHDNIAYAMVDEATYPGWGYMLENGATTLWETWAQSDNVYSQNHPMFGSVSEWFFKSLGGITPDASADGFDRFVIAPFVAADLDWMDARYESVRGAIACTWRRTNERLHMQVTIPPNTRATVHIPTTDVDSVRERGLRIADHITKRVRQARHSEVLELALGSGQYDFTAAAP